jgi:hypothetical protein
MKDITKIDYPFNDYHCKFYLTKEGKYIYYPLNKFNTYYCIFKKIIYGHKIMFPNLVGKNEDDIVNKLLIIAFCKKQNFKYIKLNNKKLTKNSLYNNIDIILFNNNVKNIENIITLKYYFLDKMKIKNENNNYYYDLINFFIKDRITCNKKIKDMEIIIKLFYIIYTNKYIMKKLNLTKDTVNISNYHSLYLLLKKKGIVSYYYNKIVPFILKNYKKVIKNYDKLPLFKKEKMKMKNKIKDFKNINIFKLINKNVNNNYDKKYIKNKFIELSKKYNI